MACRSRRYARISPENLFFFHDSARPAAKLRQWGLVFLDLTIVVQTLSFGKVAFEPTKLFYPAFFLGLITSFGAILAITYEFKDWEGE